MYDTPLVEPPTDITIEDRKTGKSVGTLSKIDKQFTPSLGYFEDDYTPLTYEEVVKVLKSSRCTWKTPFTCILDVADLIAHDGRH